MRVALERARGLVLAHGWNSTAYQILNPGIEHWFAPAGDAVVGFVRRGRVRVVAGAPICPAERLAGVAAEFEEAGRAAGDGTCYFGAEARLESIYRGAADHAMVLLGAQPVWHPARWASIVDARASLRAQLNRARNKGVAVTEWSRERATRHPALQRCLAEWLATRRLPPLHFMVEPDTLDRIFDRRVFVASRGDEVLGFVVASPVPARRGWLIEQIVRGDAAPNGTGNLLVDATVRAVAMSGGEYLTLGLSPLSRRSGLRSPPMPLWLRTTLAWVRAHGRRFYNFEGLDSFKARFQPEWWEPVFAISTESRFSPRTLYAVAAAFTGRSPVLTVAGAGGHALAQEARRAARALRRRTR